MLEGRVEAMTSLHLAIKQLVLVLGSIFVFNLFRVRTIGSAVPLDRHRRRARFSLVVFRNLLPRILTMRSPQMILLRLFPIFEIVHVARRPCLCPSAQP